MSPPVAIRPPGVRHGSEYSSTWARGGGGTLSWRRTSPCSSPTHPHRSRGPPTTCRGRMPCRRTRRTAAARTPAAPLPGCLCRCRRCSWHCRKTFRRAATATRSTCRAPESPSSSPPPCPAAACTASAPPSQASGPPAP
eukprot:CAMPEP_0173388660 /NCGR_PEP_ID=MMETSP1356-20130122/10919_1 /TAXON_ID=77927 ORGANISM="Hemiselmis virescens, Strain PCC157" /NCGR_SAMPLE_ID=MMETSP1356 /ASSEMBLY_ACC=CAM_ASM_000847 /LENGTH=138 /DNA_ID=CAMNT_0014345617 /DNA_START=164 /DNA_END=580 /DNA_ORIENTATION=-